jgi:hypothetical protein
MVLPIQFGSNITKLYYISTKVYHISRQNLYSLSVKIRIAKPVISYLVYQIYKGLDFLT